MSLRPFPCPFTSCQHLKAPLFFHRQATLQAEEPGRVARVFTSLDPVSAAGHPSCRRSAHCTKAHLGLWVHTLSEETRHTTSSKFRSKTSSFWMGPSAVMNNTCKIRLLDYRYIPPQTSRRDLLLKSRSPVYHGLA